MTTNPRGFFFCERCQLMASTRHCERCGDRLEWQHVAAHHNPFRGQRPLQSMSSPQPVNQDRARELFARIHSVVNQPGAS